MPALDAAPVRRLRLLFVLLAATALALGFWLDARPGTDSGEPTAPATQRD